MRPSSRNCSSIFDRTVSSDTLDSVAAKSAAGAATSIHSKTLAWITISFSFRMVVLLTVSMNGVCLHKTLKTLGAHKRGAHYSSRRGPRRSRGLRRCDLLSEFLDLLSNILNPFADLVGCPVCAFHHFSGE